MNAAHRTPRVALAIVMVLAASVGTALLSAQATPPRRTVWDGVYTAAQAERASGTFDQVCTRCHTLDTSGNRPVSGDKFWQAFTQKSVGDLLNYVKTNMPNGQGGSLPAPMYNDLVALILKSNGFPAGTTELAPDTIADVQIIPRGGAGELPANTLARVVGCLTKEGSDWVLTSATDPERIEKVGVGPQDATRPLGSRKTTLKFVLTRLDTYVGQRMSVSGMLLGEGGANGINVTTVNRVAETCQ